MNYKLSKFGQKLSQKSGIMELMDDLGAGIASDQTVMMGGGNPAHIPEAEEVWRQRIRELLEGGKGLDRMLGDYDAPRGKGSFIEVLAEFFSREYGFRIGPENIAVTSGSQNGFFILFNILAGQHEDGSHKKILLPICPEYIGYLDQGIEWNMFVSRRPRIELIGDRTFKYRIDFDNLKLGDDIAALCISRPTNPTGNVVTDEEIARLADLAADRGIPLLVDNAYGAPFPDVLFEETSLTDHPTIVHSFSLSKLGLPATRTGIIIGDSGLVRSISAVNSILNLAVSGIGQSIVEPLIADGRLSTLCHEVIRPWYRRKSELAVSLVEKYFPAELPYRVHKSEGAFFLWLWLKGLPISDYELYQRLKKRGVLVIAGSYFFTDDNADWEHRRECIRLTFTQDDDVMEKGIKIIAKELKSVLKGD